MLTTVDRLTEEEIASRQVTEYRRLLAMEALDAMEQAEAKHGKMHHPAIVWLSILTEEVGEVAKVVNNIEFGEGSLETVARLREELLDVAQSALSAIEQIDQELWDAEEVGELGEDDR